MGFFGELGSDLRERKRLIAAVFASACIAVATFLAGTWAGSSDMFTLHPVTASAPHPDNPPPPAAPTPGDMCCGMKMPDKMMPDMPKPSGMPMPGGMMPSETPTPGGMMPGGMMPGGMMPSGMMPSGTPMPSNSG
ncbi:MAG: hypothetical protein QOG14_1362 [Mycobacterium sp.]|jgi:hypothetical protein|nr:hypothetical protein [Mycobacterium sp.]